MIEIRALGTLELRGPEEGSDPTAVLSRPKRAAVLAYLAGARPYGPRRRDELIGMFWPELEQEKAGRALNQSVYVLRSVIGEPAVRTRASEVVLDPDLVWIDVVGFDAALAAGDTRTALDLYRGEFLRGFYLSGSRPFERWLDEEREHLRRRALGAAIGLATEEESGGHAGEATRWVRRALELSPYDQTLLRRLVTLLIEQGDPANAVRELDRFSARLSDELGLAVSSDIRDLVRQPFGAGARPPASAIHEPETDPLPVDARPETRTAAPSPGGSRGVRGGPLLGVVLFVLLSVFAGVGAGAWFWPGDPDPSERTRVMVAPLANRTGDASLDPLGRIAADWIARGLIETGLVEVVPGALPDGDRSRWSAVGQEVGAELIVAGSIQRDGADPVLSAVVHEVERGIVLRSLEPIQAAARAPLPAVERLRRRTAGALATIVDVRMERWADVASQPPSFEAYRVYAEGLELLENERYLEAGDRFLDAAGRDSTFTSALVWAIEAYSLTGRGPRDSLVLALAPERDGLAPFDRAMLDRHLARMQGDLSGEYEALRGLVGLSPTSQWQVLLAQQAIWLNRPAQAERILASVEPGSVRGIPERMWWGLGAEALHMQGKFSEELDRVRRWREAGPGSSSLVESRELRALAGVGRAAEVLAYVDDQLRFRAWTDVSRDPSSSVWFTAHQLRTLALELRAHGHPEAADVVLERILDLYDASPDSVRRHPQARRQLGRTLLSAGRWAEARAVFEQLLEHGHEPWIARGDLAIGAAALGDRSIAEEVDRFYADMAASNPADNGWATQWRARIAALLGDRDRAVGLMAQAHEEGWPHWSQDHLVEEYVGLRGYGPFDEFMRLKDG